MNRPGILLEVVQVLSDLDLTITKAYITSDGTWLLDGKRALSIWFKLMSFGTLMMHLFVWSAVFHVTDQQGRKLTDKKTIEYIEKVNCLSMHHCRHHHHHHHHQYYLSFSLYKYLTCTYLFISVFLGSNLIDVKDMHRYNANNVARQTIKV